MARKTEPALFAGLAPKPQPAAAPEPVREAPPPAPNPAQRKARQGQTFTGFYVDEAGREALRELAYRTRTEKQDILRMGLNLMLILNNMQPVGYAKTTISPDDLADLLRLFETEAGRAAVRAKLKAAYQSATPD